jgi:hypothetical protein
MTASEVFEKLLAEGCNKSHFSIHRSEHDAFCLVRRGNEWFVYYSERGQDYPPEYTSASEDDACEFFYTLVMNQQHWHIVGFFKNENDAKQLEVKGTDLFTVFATYRALKARCARRTLR